MRKEVSKKKIVTITSVSVVAISIGTGLGIFFGQEFLGPRTDYDAYDLNYYEDDIGDLYNRYQNSSNPLVDFKPYELVNIAYHEFEELTSNYVVTDGDINASIINQTLCSVSIKNDGMYFNESISSSSMVQVAKRFYQEDGLVTTYDGGNIIEGKKATWNEENKSVDNLKDYEEVWGKTLSRSSIYIVSSKTVLNSTIEEVDDGYLVSIDLDPVTSVLRYVKQMAKMSNLSRKPQFDKVHMEIKLNDNMQLIERVVNESYTVYMMGAHQSNATIIDKYYQNQIDIPTLDDNFEYGGI